MQREAQGAHLRPRAQRRDAPLSRSLHAQPRACTPVRVRPPAAPLCALGPPYTTGTPRLRPRYSQRRAIFSRTTTTQSTLFSDHPPPRSPRILLCTCARASTWELENARVRKCPPRDAVSSIVLEHPQMIVASVLGAGALAFVPGHLPPLSRSSPISLRNHASKPSCSSTTSPRGRRLHQHRRPRAPRTTMPALMVAFGLSAFWLAG